MKRIIIIAIVLASLLSLSCTSFAAETIAKETLPQAASDETPSIQPLSTTCTLSFKKTSSTKARAFAAASRSKASSITSTIYLQKKSGSLLFHRHKKYEDREDVHRTLSYLYGLLFRQLQDKGDHQVYERRHHSLQHLLQITVRQVHSGQCCLSDISFFAGHPQHDRRS